MGPIVRVLVVLLCGLTATAALASTYHEVDVTCPIDGQVFKTREAKSGTKLGNYLDMKPYGPMPAPWPIARCPGNGFVIYRPVFSSEELQRFRAYVATDEYRALLRPHSNYYLAARLQIHNGEPPRQVAYTLLKASWEAEGTELYPRYAREAPLTAAWTTALAATVGAARVTSRAMFSRPWCAAAWLRGWWAARVLQLMPA